MLAIRSRQCRRILRLSMRLWRRRLSRAAFEFWCVPPCPRGRRARYGQQASARAITSSSQQFFLNSSGCSYSLGVTLPLSRHFFDHISSPVCFHSGSFPENRRLLLELPLNRTSVVQVTPVGHVRKNLTSGSGSGPE
jgi:hypothetical protein